MNYFVFVIVSMKYKYCWYHQNFINRFYPLSGTGWCRRLGGTIQVSEWWEELQEKSGILGSNGVMLLWV